MSKKQFNVDDPCIILVEDKPVETSISKKVSIDEKTETGIVNTTMLYVACKGNQDQYTGSIFADKASMLSELSSHLK